MLNSAAAASGSMRAPLDSPTNASAMRKDSAASFNASSAMPMPTVCGVLSVKLSMPPVAPLKSAAAALSLAIAQATRAGRPSAGGAPSNATVNREMPPSATPVAPATPMEKVRSCWRYRTLMTASPLPLTAPPRASTVSVPKATVSTPAVAVRCTLKSERRRISPLLWPAGTTICPPVRSVNAGGNAPEAATVYGTVTSPALMRSKFTLNATVAPSSTVSRRCAGAKVAVSGSSSSMMWVKANSSAVLASYIATVAVWPMLRPKRARGVKPGALRTKKTAVSSASFRSSGVLLI